MNPNKVRIEPSESDSILPECPVKGCDHQSYNPHRMHDHLTDDHELWETIMNAEVYIER